MESVAKFIIERRDIDRHLDDAKLACGCLIIGSHRDSDLVLNHPNVSPEQAGIVSHDGKFWLCDLVQEADMVVSNQPVAEPVLLKSGDEVLIGPYQLAIDHIEDCLSIKVRVQLATDDEKVTAGIVITNLDGTRGTSKDVITPKGQEQSVLNDLLTRRLADNSKRQLDPLDLDRFLKKYQARRAADSRTAPHEGDSTTKQPQVKPLKVKSRRKNYAWRPTLDLREFRWKPVYFWVFILVTATVLTFTKCYPKYLSPGTDSHDLFSADMSMLGRRNIAHLPTPRLCSDCHGGNVLDQCASCHTTSELRDQPGKVFKGFQPTVYEPHRREGLNCKACHLEHGKQGDLIAFRSCASCHNGSYTIKAGERAGQRLLSPHGGTVGYPVNGGKWTWPGLALVQWERKGIPYAATQLPKEQFHLLHRNRFKCVDCHTKGVFGDAQWREGPRARCAECHAISFTAAGARRGSANCNTCHQQHGTSRDLDKLLEEETKEPNIKNYLAKLAIGESADDTTGSS
jgi:hypothetical protein